MEKFDIKVNDKSLEETESSFIDLWYNLEEIHKSNYNNAEKNNQFFYIKYKEKDYLGYIIYKSAYRWEYNMYALLVWEDDFLKVSIDNRHNHLIHKVDIQWRAKEKMVYLLDFNEYLEWEKNTSIIRYLINWVKTD